MDSEKFVLTFMCGFPNNSASETVEYKRKNTIDANFFRVASIVFNKDGGECEIRTHGGSPHHQFSRLAP